MIYVADLKIVKTKLDDDNDNNGGGGGDFHMRSTLTYKECISHVI